MLISLFGSNFRSLRDPFELSMVAADLKRSDDSKRGVIEVPLEGSDEPLKLLRTIGVFGHNGSGKSTVLLVADALRWLVQVSSQTSKPGDRIRSFEPFILDKNKAREAVNLGCQVVFANSILRYEISFRAEVIDREKLTISSADSHVVLIDRNTAGDIKGRLIEKSPSNQLYVKAMQPNVAVLSKLAQHGPSGGDDSAWPYWRAIGDALMYVDYSAAAGWPHHLWESRFTGEGEYRDWIMSNLMARTDVGIENVAIERRDQNKTQGPAELKFDVISHKLEPVPVPGSGAVSVAFVHRGKDTQPLDFSAESTGTKKLFNISGDWWTLAHREIVLLADELSAGLHPRLVDSLIRAVNDAPPDRVRSQLIFATHDTGLLEGQNGQPPALRRDQVYFTKKNADGASELYSLAEFKEDARPVHNLRKRYLAGLYGAVPLLEKLSL